MSTTFPRPPSDYRVEADALSIASVAGEVFRLCWRKTLALMGFAFVALPRGTTSTGLRSFMFELVSAFPIRFRPERLGRFDQQVTSRFHRDGAPAESLLLLGYEPTEIASSLSFADAHAAAQEANLDTEQLLQNYNPMFADGESRLQAFSTSIELPLGESFIVAINNCHFAASVDDDLPLGVLHKAVVPKPNPEFVRVINSVGLATAGPSKSNTEIHHFLMRDDLD